jgi:hypothetical protein
MATVAQQCIDFPSSTDCRDTVIGAPQHILPALRRSAMPDAPPAGLIVLSGHAAVYRLGLCAAVDRALSGESVVYLAGANMFDPFLVGRLARASRIAPSRVLQQIHVSRAFTCHQMVRLVVDCLASAVHTYDARRVILSGPLETLYDESVPEHEAARLFRTMLTSLQRLAQQDIQVLCVSPLPTGVSSVRRGFFAVLRAQARRVIDVRETEDGVRLYEQEAAESKQWKIPRLVWNRL